MVAHYAFSSSYVLRLGVSLNLTKRPLFFFYKAPEYDVQEYVQWATMKSVSQLYHASPRVRESRWKSVNHILFWVLYIDLFTDTVYDYDHWIVSPIDPKHMTWWVTPVVKYARIDPELYHLIMENFRYPLHSHIYYFHREKKWYKPYPAWEAIPFGIRYWHRLNILLREDCLELYPNFDEHVSPELDFNFYDSSFFIGMRFVMRPHNHERFNDVYISSIPFSYSFFEYISARMFVPRPVYLLPSYPHKKYRLVLFSKYFKTVFFLKLSKLFFLFYSFLKKTLVAVCVSIIFIVFSFIFFKMALLRVGSGWLAIFFFVFWLLSGFNFFLKHYRFGKYTTANQRFWKRALMCFWLIEGFLFVIFFYYALNASAEPVFMYDQVGLYNKQLQSIDDFLSNAFLVVSVINLIAYFLITIKFTTYRQQSILILIVTFILVYILMSESYQFYYLSNYYDESFWVFSEDDLVWELEYEIPRARNKNHYMTLIILAKFWHYIFIFGSWTFFVMKSLELSRSRYALLSMNLQNLIIFYIMNWVCVYSWLKWLTRRFLDQQYYWFFSSYRPTTFSSILLDCCSLLKAAIFHLFNYFLHFFLVSAPKDDMPGVYFLDVFGVGSRAGSCFGTHSYNNLLF